MNKADVIEKVSEKSGIGMEDCQKVLDAFEDVFTDEFAQSENISHALDKMDRFWSFLKSKKR
ncbi:HU family DNA-binding protein [Siminovitchia sp. 179-K 8D1 HS]|uniref:HU family DNA-binding protein n=1 Tax=Siminovitchia sp. 179-K 8D1 HS TaxID=3142385 RepID=UPI0039A0CFBC